MMEYHSRPVVFKSQVSKFYSLDADLIEWSLRTGWYTLMSVGNTVLCDQSTVDYQ